MNLIAGHLLSGLPQTPPAEVFEPILAAAGLKLERIISTGQATPTGQWLVQDWDEWVLLAAGEAGLQFQGEAAARELRPGDWINIPAGAGHRVTWTSLDPPAVWLALHYNLQRAKTLNPTETAPPRP
jgi:cupin 2 domain-containing protein